MPEIESPAVETGFEVVLHQRAAVDLVLADSAVVATLRLGVAGRGEPVRAAVLHERELLLDAEQWLVLLVLLGGPGRCGAGVGRMRLAVDEHHLAHHEHVVAATDRVRVARDGLEDAVALVAGGLTGARSVESPDREFGAVFQDLGLRAELRRRLSSVDPDVFSLVNHSCPQFLGGTGEPIYGFARWQAESSQRRVAESLPHCERRVNSPPSTASAEPCACSCDGYVSDR